MTGGPQFRQPRRGRRGVWAVVAAAVAAVVALAAVVVAVPWSSRSGDGDATAPAPATVSGDYEQWVAAVCTPGSLLRSSAPQFLGALDQGSCAAIDTPAGAAPVALTILTWPTSEDVAERMAHFPATHLYAVAAGEDRSTVFTVLDSSERSVLEPLTRFGFAIIALP